MNSLNPATRALLIEQINNRDGEIYDAEVKAFTELLFKPEANREAVLAQLKSFKDGRIQRENFLLGLLMESRGQYVHQKRERFFEAVLIGMMQEMGTPQLGLPYPLVESDAVLDVDIFQTEREKAIRITVRQDETSLSSDDTPDLQRTQNPPVHGA